MGWSYHFLDLSQAQKLERRETLDFWGLLAQISVAPPLLLIILLSYLTSWLSQTRQGLDGAGTGSPQLKRNASAHGRGLSRRWRQLQWWMGDDLKLLSYQFGTKGEIVGAAVWTVWLVACCFMQTGQDYFHLTKRFGTIAASQLPLQYLLAFKSPYSPLQKLTGTSHETINVAHQLLGRIVTVLLYVHAALYLNFYVQSGLLSEKLGQFFIICGIVGVVAFTAVGTTALAPVRRWSYRVFYATHVVLATFLLPVLWLHVSHIRIYLYETAAIYVLNAVLRALCSKERKGTIRLLPDTDLVEITMKDSRAWEPGQHAYLSLPGNPLLRTFRSNPFTVASLPVTDSHLKFVARVLDGNTARLAQQSKYSDTTQRTTLEGPYGASTHPDRLLSYDRVLFVAGGVGATFVVPLYRQLLADLSPGKGTYRRQKVSILWIARSMADVTWALPEERGEREGFVERLSLCLTASPGGSGRSLGGGESRETAAEQPGDLEEGIELEEQKGLLPAGEASEDEGVKAGPSDLAVYAGRPNLKKVVDETFSHGPTERVAMVVCGPRRLSKALRHEVRPWVMDHGRDVWFWEEAFGL